MRAIKIFCKIQFVIDRDVILFKINIDFLFNVSHLRIIDQIDYYQIMLRNIN